MSNFHVTKFTTNVTNVATVTNVIQVTKVIKMLQKLQQKLQHAGCLKNYYIVIFCLDLLEKSDYSFTHVFQNQNREQKGILGLLEQI